MKLHFYISIVLLLCTYSLRSQNLYTDEHDDITLSDGLEIQIHKKWGINSDANQYFYMPVNLQFSVTKNQEPEFSFLEYNYGGATAGAIMHFLISWGLTKNQLYEVQDSLISIKGVDARLMGAVFPEVMDADNGFTIEGESSLVAVLNRSRVSVGKTPTMPKTKIAASFQFNKEDAAVFQNALKSNGEELKKISVSITYIINFRTSRKEHKLEKNFYKLLNQIL